MGLAGAVAREDAAVLLAPLVELAHLAGSPVGREIDLAAVGWVRPALGSVGPSISSAHQDRST